MKSVKNLLVLFLLFSVFIIGCNDSKDSNSQKIKSSKTQDNTESISFKEQGFKYAVEAKGVLGKNLFTAIKTKGIANAISFCNEKAYFLTDSVASKNGVKIKRVSDKNRNQNNKANSEELAYINSVKEIILKGQKAKPQINELENSVVGYYPIIANQLCMKCHGNPETEIEKETLSKISSLYPKDKATGYSPGELRGIWVIEMRKL
jgi:hypothetical protein